MSIAAFKDTVDALSKYADTRAQSSDSRSKVGVQSNSSGAVSFIAGSGRGTIVVRNQSVPVESTGSYSFAIDAKPLIQAAKVLKGKGTVSIKITDDSMRVITDGGGELVLNAVSDVRSVGFLMKPKNTEATARVKASTWQQMSKIIPAIASLDMEPATISLRGGTCDIACVSPGARSMYARLSIDGSGVDGTTASVSNDFWESLKSFENDGDISWGSSGVYAKAGNLESWSGPIMSGDNKGNVFQAEPWPSLFCSGSPVSHAEVQRTSLIDAIKGVVPSEDKDEYGRITIEVDGNQLRLSAFGDESYISMACKGSGKSIRSIRSEYIIKALRACGSKVIGLSTYNSPPIRITSDDMNEWTVLVAPVALG